MCPSATLGGDNTFLSQPNLPGTFPIINLLFAVNRRRKVTCFWLHVCVFCTGGWGELSARVADQFVFYTDRRVSHLHTMKNTAGKRTKRKTIPPDVKSVDIRSPSHVFVPSGFIIVFLSGKARTFLPDCADGNIRNNWRLDYKIIIKKNSSDVI